jgi:hypothetical protein
LAFAAAAVPVNPSNSFSRPNSLILLAVKPLPVDNNLEFSATTNLEALAAASNGAANCLSIGISLTILFKPSKVLTEKF